MKTLLASCALLPDGWNRDVRVDIGRDGRISSVTTGVEPRSSPPGSRRVSLLLPAMSNVHSHTFQRCFAGDTEVASGPDDFWSWRRAMYDWAWKLEPDDIEAFAALAFAEMLESGYAAVGEFHYLHHSRSGSPYEQIAETSLRILAAARETGIGLLHLPVLYSYSGAGERELLPEQKRFACDLAQYERLIETCRELFEDAPADFALGLAPHSLRATSPRQLQELTEELHRSDWLAALHLHIAEQVGEVQEVERHNRERPVQWLLEHCDVDQRWCLIHATHMQDSEAIALAETGATVGLCPITEANLGDGLFPAPLFLEAGGHIGIGTDSNISISLREELRMLEYGQRLLHRRRNVLTQAPSEVTWAANSTGAALYAQALEGGARACARDSGSIKPGHWADLVVLDGAALAGEEFAKAGNQLLDRWLFAARRSVVRDVYSAGRRVVEEGRHVQRMRIEAQSARALRRVRERQR